MYIRNLDFSEQHFLGFYLKLVSLLVSVREIALYLRDI